MAHADADSTNRDDSGLFAANRAALRARWGVDPCGTASAGRPGAVGPPTPSDVRVAAESLDIQLPDGRWHPVHPAKGPLDDAHDWLQTTLGAAAGMAPTLCVIGAGAGWIVDAIAARSDDARVLVLEPEPAFVPLMLERRDYRPLIDAGRLMILAGPDFEGGAGAWRLFGRCIGDPALLIHPAIAVARRPATVAAARLVQRALGDARSNEQARRRFAAPYLLQTLANLPSVSAESDAAALFGLCPRRPVVVAGAGPSLNRNLEELRPLRDRVVLVAADTALRPCLAAGLTPDLVVAVDPGAANARHLTGLPEGATSALVAEASLRSAALAAFAGRMYFYRVAAHHPWPWLLGHGVDVATLRAWGSVLITAFDLAVRLGGDPVIFIGVDLAFTDGQPYCRGTVYEEDWTAWQAAGQALTDIWQGAIAMHPAVSERHGDETIATAPHLVQFRDALLEASRTASCRVVNATGRGILRGPAVAAQTLRETLATASPVVMPPLPRQPISRAAIAQLRAAVAGKGSAGADDAQVPAPDWTAVLAEHEPPDSGLATALATTLDQLAVWAAADAASRV